MALESNSIIHAFGLIAIAYFLNEKLLLHSMFQF